MFIIAGKEKRGHLVEWIEKPCGRASTASLNLKSLSEVHGSSHGEQFEGGLEPPTLFVPQVLSRIALTSPVPRKHFFIKDLKFYEVVRVPDNETC